MLSKWILYCSLSKISCKFSTKYFSVLGSPNTTYQFLFTVVSRKHLSRCFQHVWGLLQIFWNGITIKWMVSLLIKDSSEERTSEKENVPEDVWMRRCNAGKWMAWARPGVRDLKSKQLRKTGQAVLNLRLARFA